MNKTQVLKIAKTVSVAGGAAYLVLLLGKSETKRKEELARANTLAAMFGSLAGYVGDEVVRDWQEELSNEEDLESMEGEGLDEEEPLEVQPISDQATDARGDTISDVVEEAKAASEDNPEEKHRVIEIPMGIHENVLSKPPAADKDVLVDMDSVEKESAVDGTADEAS